MPGGDRRGGQANSARAAELAKQAKGKGLLGAGFAGFSGSRPVNQYYKEEEPSVSGEALDGDIQQFLKHLSKSNPTTKLKALQGLNAKLQDCGVSDLVALLPKWIHAYRRLVTDGDRGVRVKSQEVLEIIVSNLKRELAPHLKSVIGPWWMAQHDLHKDTRLAAISAFQAAFPEPKRKGAILFCHQELLKHLTENLSMDVKALGDPKKEDKEALEIRYESMTFASISALSKLLEISSESDEKDSKAGDAIRSEIAGMISTRSFFKKHFASHSPVVRQSAHALVESACNHASTELSNHVPGIAGNVIGAVGEKEPSCQSTVWSMVLTFVKTFPESWKSAHLRKAVIPRLCSVLRHSGDAVGLSEAVSMAVLPFLNQIPRELWESKPDMLVKVMESAWMGAKGQKQPEAQTTGVDLLKECMLWGLLSGSTLSNDELDFQNGLLSGVVSVLFVPAIMEERLSDGVLAKACLTKSIERLAALSKKDIKSSAGRALKALLERLKSDIVSQATPSSAAPEGSADSRCIRVADLMSELVDSENQWLVSVVSEFVGRPVGAVLVDRGIRHDSDVKLVQALAKMVKVYGPSVLSFQGSDASGGPTAMSLHDRLFDRLLEFFSMGSPDENLKGAFSDLMLSSLIGANDKDWMRDHWGTMLCSILKSIETGEEASENHNGFALLLIEGIVTLEEEIQKWFACKALSFLAISCLEPSRLNSSASVRILRNLIGHHKTLLSEATFVKILENFEGVFQRGAEVGDEEAAVGVIEALSGVLFDGGVPETDGGLLAWEKLVLEVALMAWEGRDEDKATFNAARLLWSGGEGLNKLRSKVPLQVHSIALRLQERVVQSLQDSTQTDSHSTKRLASETAEIVSMAQTSQDKFKTLDPMLAAFDSQWMRWCKPGGRLSDGQALEEGGEAHFMIGYISELMGLIGFEDFLGGLHHSDARPWLAVEMLCESQMEHVESKIADSIVDHLIVSTLAAASGENDPSIMAGVLEICLKGALGSVRPKTYLALLQNVLTALVEHASEEGAIETINKFFSNRLGGADIESNQEKVLLEILPLVVPALRMAPPDHSAQSEEELEGRSLECLEAARKLPALSCSANSSSIDTFKMALAHFPVEPSMRFGKNSNVRVTDSEKNALVELLRDRHCSPDKRPASEKERRDVRHIFGELDLVVVAYCHDLLEETDWQGILHRVKLAVNHSSVCLENAVETLSDAVVEIAETVAISVDSATMALQLLSRITDKGRADGLGMLDTLDTMKESGSLVEELKACTASTKSLVFLLNLDPQGSSPIAHQKWRCEEIVKATIAHGARSVLCGAAMMCLAECCGKEVQQSLLEILTDTIEFWDAVGELVDGALSIDQVIPESLRSMDIWAEEIGVDGVRCSLALALGSHPFPRLRKVGVHMLTSEPAVRQLTPQETTSEEELAKWREEQGQQDINESVYLVQAGIHPSVAPALVKPEALQNFLLSWAFILIHLMELPPDSDQRENLKSTLMFPASLVSNLLNKLVSILPLPEVTSSKRGKTFAKPVIGKKGGLDVSLKEFVGGVGVPSSEQEWEILAVHMYRSVLGELPACGRMWFADLKDRSLVSAIEAYTSVAESPALIKKELESVETSHEKSESFRTRCIPARGEVVAIMEVEDGATLELVIRLPSCMPLRPAEVECLTRVGVTDGQLRKWLFSISIFLRHCSVVEAVALWKKNLNKEFQGVEPCLICYSVIHPSSRELPKLRCGTCHVQLHGACLYRWFRQSSKSQCPHCQSPWSVGGRAE
ncbi:hypothetical protein BSKO_10387 [Bryopsis sp. KO-2023]|nr:hypothetical protein BSKO_10387 [Bryopsis sp. KO-2023]